MSEWGRRTAVPPLCALLFKELNERGSTSMDATRADGRTDIDGGERDAPPRSDSQTPRAPTLGTRAWARIHTILSISSRALMPFPIVGRIHLMGRERGGEGGSMSSAAGTTIALARSISVNFFPDFLAAARKKERGAACLPTACLVPPCPSLPPTNLTARGECEMMAKKARTPRVPA